MVHQTVSFNLISGGQYSDKVRKEIVIKPRWLILVHIGRKAYRLTTINRFFAG